MQSGGEYDIMRASEFVLEVPMVDIHCHILPGVDDGAEELEDALKMAKMAAASGVKTIVATPHCDLPGSERKNFASEELVEQYALLREAIRAEGIPITLLLGAEVLCTPRLEEHLRMERLATLADTRYLLVEFFFDESVEYMERQLARVASFGLVPVVAHPERYEAVQRFPMTVERWFSRGYVIQLNKGSILGRLGGRAEAAAEWILEQGLAHVVASDAHSPVVRTPHMHEVWNRVVELTGREYAQVLLERNPGRIVRDRPMVEI